MRYTFESDFGTLVIRICVCKWSDNDMSIKMYD